MTKVTKMISKATAALAASLVFATIFAGSAFAATVQGTDCYGTGGELESGDVDVLNVTGEAHESVFLSVDMKGRQIARDLAYTIGEGQTQGYGSEWTGVVSLDITGYNTSLLDGSYTIKAYSDRTDGTLLYEGSLYGVYADLPDKTSKLIGVRTIGEGEQDRPFSAPETLYINGVTYKVAGEPTGKDALHIPYEAYDEAGTVDGVIKYIDMQGNLLTSTPIVGIPYDGEQTEEIPTTVTADNGDVYRTVYFKNSVTAHNPGQTSFTITCAKVADADKAAASYYVATIKMVDDDGNVIATDSVNVTGDFLYTAPSAIYKNVTDPETGAVSVRTYNLEGDPTLRLSASVDGVTDHARTIQVSYAAEPEGAKQVPVTFKLIDGSKRVGKSGRSRSLGTLDAVVNEENPVAVPEATVEAKGSTYTIAGSPEDYAYTYGSGEAPVVNVYYLPEGYHADGPYTVTVNYVNFLTGEVVDSATVESSPDDMSAISIDVPASFDKDGVTYLRLDGQGDTISHSYYSDIKSYTVYYRDENDTLTSGTVINTIRVVYRDGGTTDLGVTDLGTTDLGTTETDADAGTTELALDGDRTYNVLDGEDGSASLTNESGVDSNAERIDDDANPLASGVSDADSGFGLGQGGATQQSGIPTWAIAVAVAAIVVVALAVFLFLRRRRHAGEASEE